ncbi:hypothetical protein PVAND_000465 [Polypedilum vanderplanki]|uniref:Ropporin-1-like protein n=1 Tax=Polypedilum vanderplanki TaxID=319348 RepID=A0A9J6BJW6_POLVA|nr:hypothetical protein PVAND_000465 [Polypedilum vanderplanki]
MYCSEQIVIPEKISNLLKTYAKAALKTQPYDLLRWSAAYFRCLSMDILPPVKHRYELENSFGCQLTKGYMKVLMSQLGKGYFVSRDILEHRWSELCLPEVRNTILPFFCYLLINFANLDNGKKDELLKFLSLTRMLYWPQVHWLKILSVMVGSINQNFHETVMMLFELLTDEPEGGASPVPLWLIRECLKYLAKLDCSDEQTFFDGRKMLSGNELEDETKMPSIPQKLSSTSFRNAVIDYWKFRIENDEKLKSMHDDVTISKDDDKVCTLCSIPSTLRCGSEFSLSGDYSNPLHVIENSCDFKDVILVVKNLKCTKNDDELQSQIVKRDEKVEEQREQAAQEIEENARAMVDKDCCDMLRDIGPPWNWLHNFTSQNSRMKSYNFLERNSICPDITPDDEEESSDESLIAAAQPPPSVFEDVQSSISGIQSAATSGVSKPSSEHKAIVDAICNISTASENGECNIRDTPSIATQLCEQLSKKQLEPVDYERLKKFIDRASENGLVFNDLNALYNYFIQESSREHFSSNNETNAEVENVIMPSSVTQDAEVNENNNIATPSASTLSTDGKNVVAIFGESGIEVDNKLLDAKVSERMILGLVDKTQSDIDNISDIASSNASMSSLSHAETVKLQVTREKNTQTMSYRDRVHEKRLQSGLRQASGSSVTTERQPYVCKVPALPGIGASFDNEKIEKILKFITQRSFQQGGFVYPRNFLEADCPSLMEMN